MFDNFILCVFLAIFLTALAYGWNFVRSCWASHDVDEPEDPAFEDEEPTVPIPRETIAEVSERWLAELRSRPTVDLKMRPTPVPDEASRAQTMPLEVV